MRPIKFRAWDKENGDMLKSCGVMENEVCMWEDGVWGGIVKDSDLIPMQYTGLKDKNGVEIYEGDIVEAKFSYWYRRYWKDLKDKEKIDKDVIKQKKKIEKESKTISFSRGCFKWGVYTLNEFSQNDKLQELIERGEQYPGEWETKWFDFEVIGNVYQNEDLLT